MGNTNSGIYGRFGTEKKDVITEATAQEFKNWMAIKGFNISFISDNTLNGVFLDKKQPFRQWQIRCAFIADIEAKGITIRRHKDQWNAFSKIYDAEAIKIYG